MSAAKVKQQIGDDIWDSYFKFAFDRNPWDKTVTEYYGRTRQKSAVGIDFFIEQQADRFTYYNFPVYSLNGKVAVDFVGRYENIEQDLATALSKVGIAFDGWLPRTPDDFSPNQPHYSEILGDVQRETVERRFASEIETLGYEYEERRAA